MGRTRWDRRRTRGTAAVEMILTVPFLMIFALAMLDFAAGYRTRSQSARAARQVAWMTARHVAFKTAAAPNAETIQANHLHKENTDVTVQKTDSFKQTISIPGLKQLGEAISWAQGGLNFSLGDGLLDFLVGTCEMSAGSVSSKIKGRFFFEGIILAKGDIGNVHYVALDSKPEDNPSKPLGWFDPYQSLLELLGID